MMSTPGDGPVAGRVRRSHPRVLAPRTWSDHEYARQAAWLRRDCELSENDYAPTIERNAPYLTSAGRAELLQASGSELSARAGALPKFCAPWSSSALVANVFDYWRGRDLVPLVRALDAPPHTSYSLEHKLETGFSRAPANLDVAIFGADAPLVAIEAKFLEPFGSAERGTPKDNIQPVYLDSRRIADWNGLIALRGLAERIAGGDILFRRLDAPQLIKHSLALRRRRAPFELLFIWFTPPADRAETTEMRSEIEQFANAARADQVAFRSLTYQDLYGRLLIEARGHTDYLAYLGSRYFL
jgi:hypothetical protein